MGNMYKTRTLATQGILQNVVLVPDKREFQLATFRLLFFILWSPGAWRYWDP